MNWKRTARWSWLILPFLLLAVWPGATAAWDEDGLVADAVLYEVWEDVFLPPTPVLTNSVLTGLDLKRVAAISGSAKIETAVCAVVHWMNPNASTCSLTAVGTNIIHLDATGTPLMVPIDTSGTFDIVVQFDNPFDSPELVVTTGSLAGKTFPKPLPPGTPKRLKKEFQALNLIPLFAIIGQFTIDGQHDPISFTGTFRLPFGFNEHGEMVKKHRGEHAFYLSDTGGLIRVKRDEFSIGFPTVRIEFTFN